jgi:hypothetical protein
MHTIPHLIAALIAAVDAAATAALAAYHADIAPYANLDAYLANVDAIAPVVAQAEQDVALARFALAGALVEQNAWHLLPIIRRVVGDAQADLIAEHRHLAAPAGVAA